MYNITGIWGKVWTDGYLVQKGKQEDKKGGKKYPEILFATPFSQKMMHVYVNVFFPTEFP